MVQKITIHIGNMSADEAQALCEELLDMKFNAEQKAEVKKLEVNGKIPKGNMFNAIEVDKAEMGTNALTQLLAELFGEDLGGPAPDYNGVLGDSCDCPRCNIRRAEGEADPLRDLDDLKITSAQSYEALKAGYGKTGRDIPKEALDINARLADVARNFLQSVLPPNNLKH